jgi:type IV secretion system protein VirB10
MRRSPVATALILVLGHTISLRAAVPERDFSGKWVLDQVASRIRAFAEVETGMVISQDDGGIRCSTGPVQWSYALDGSETRKRVGEETWNSAVKWEGAALLINKLVSGRENYTVMDRWVLSHDRETLTVTRQVVRAGGQQEGTLVFRREGAAPAYEPDVAPAVRTQPGLAKRPEPGVPPDITVPIGTRVLLSLINEVSTKHAKEGDRVYLRTDVPVAVNGWVVIPRGSDVAGTITRTKPAGKVSGKGELFLRFDSLILPNGVSRDFHARPPGSEGQVPGNGKSADGRTVMMGTGIGAGVGAMTRGLPGAAVGGGAGALAGVLLSRNQDVVLRAGTHLEMVLDRDLVFHPDEIPR